MAERCEQCLTEGFMFVPTRTGYIFNDKSLEKVDRLLREGYLYILDDKGNWYGYVITEKRYFKQFNVEDIESTPKLPVNDGICNKGTNCKTLSSFIRIPDPDKEIATLWFAYSPVKWTKKLLDQRKKDRNLSIKALMSYGMNSFDLARYRKEGGMYVGSIRDIGWNIMDNAKLKPAAPDRVFLPIEYHGRLFTNPLTKNNYQPDRTSEFKSFVGEIWSTYNDDTHEMFAISVGDPIGKLIDLNEFMIDAQMHFAEADEDVRKYLVGKLVQNLKANLHKKQDADSERLTSRVIGRNDSDYKNAIEMARITGREEEALRLEREYAEIKTKQAGNLPDYMKGQRDHVWSDYAKHINETSMNAFLTSHEHERSQQMIKLNAIIDELAKAYKEVYQSDTLFACMTHNFDKDDDLSRVYYTLTVQQFLGSTANISMLADLYAEEMNDKSAQDERSYINRALIFNQDDVAQKVEDINATAGFTSNEVLTTSWSGLLYAGSANIFTKYDDIANQVDAIVGLTEQLAEPFLKRLSNNSTINKLRPSRSHFLFGYHSEMGLLYVTGQGSYVQAKNALTQGILKLSGDKVTQSKVTRGVEQALDSLGEKARLQTQITQNFLYFYSKADFKSGISVYNNSQKTSADRAKLQTNISESINTKTSLSDKHYTNFKSFEQITNKEIKMANTRSFTGAMLQGVACVFLTTALVNSSNKKEDGSKLIAGVSMLIAGEVERHSNAAKFRQNNLQMMQKAGNSIDGAELALLKNRVSFLRFGAGLLNIGGAGVFAYFDYQVGNQARDNNNNTAAAAYYGSASTGLVSSVFLVIGGVLATPGLVLLVGFISINLFIGFWIKSGMENWLLYGTWGNERNMGWSAKHELEQYKKAVAGEDIDLEDN